MIVEVLDLDFDTCTEQRELSKHHYVPHGAPRLNDGAEGSRV